MMREVTPEEGSEWTGLAQRHGYVTADGRVILNQFEVAERVSGRIRIRLITPVAAPLLARTGERKPEPILFDRGARGEIMLPAAWWPIVWERLAERAEVRGEAEMAEQQAERIVGDLLLPESTDTIRISVSDERGLLIEHEALPPGAKIDLILDLLPPQ